VLSSGLASSHGHAKPLVYIVVSLGAHVPSAAVSDERKARSVTSSSDRQGIVGVVEFSVACVSF
jgi:hypothetical protein